MNEARPFFTKRCSSDRVRELIPLLASRQDDAPEACDLEAMGASASRAKPVPERTPVPAGKVRVCVAGFAVSVSYTHLTLPTIYSV